MLLSRPLLAGACVAALLSAAPAQTLIEVSGRYLSEGVEFGWRGYQPAGTSDDLPLFVWPQRPGFSGWTAGEWNYENTRWMAAQFNCVAVVVEFDNTRILAPPVSLQSVFDSNLILARAVFAGWDPDSALNRVAAATRFDPAQGCYNAGNSQGGTTSMLGQLVNPIDVRATTTMGVGVHIHGQGVNGLCSHSLFEFSGVDVLALDYDFHRVWRVRTMMAEDDFVYVGPGSLSLRRQRAQFTMEAMTRYTALNADGTGAILIPEGFGPEGHNPQLSPQWPTSALPYGRTAMWTWLMTYRPPVTYHGSVVAGTGGRRPAVTTGSKPTIGNRAFSVDVVNALPGAACCLLLGSAPSSVPVMGHLVQTTGDLYVAQLVADADGRASYPVRIPANEGLVGFAVHAQVFVADPAGASGFASGHRTRIEIVAPD